MTLERQTSRTGKDWSKELPLFTEIPVQGKSAAKTGKRMIRDMLPAEKVYGMPTADDLDKLDKAVPRTAILSTKPKSPESSHRG